MDRMYSLSGESRKKRLPRGQQEEMKMNATAREVIRHLLKDLLQRTRPASLSLHGNDPSRMVRWTPSI